MHTRRAVHHPPSAVVHFRPQGKLEHQFSGADENGMRQMVAQIARKAEEMDIELSLGALEAFYQKHDPSKLSGVDEIYEKYPGALPPPRATRCRARRLSTLAAAVRTL